MGLRSVTFSKTRTTPRSPDAAAGTSPSSRYAVERSRMVDELTDRERFILLHHAAPRAEPGRMAENRAKNTIVSAATVVLPIERAAESKGSEVQFATRPG